MTNIKPQTLKGFRDFLPQEARKRQYVVNTLKGVFESFGFEPLETPALEYEEILLGKYGEEGDKLMYRFEDNGKRRVALRYDQTVPLARVVSQYQNDLPIPFKRYQVQPVWRAENTQKGRFREFYQCDADIVGSDSALSDAEVIATAIAALKKLGFETFKVLINDRENLKFTTGGITLDQDKNIKAVRAIDKLKKFGREAVLKELLENGFSEKEASEVMETVEKTEPTKRLTEIFSVLRQLGISDQFYEFSPTLARGLDYYTGLIFEIEVDGYLAGSICGGGRYDKLIGMFMPVSRQGAERDIPAVGFALGFDRLLEAMEELNLFPDTTKVSTTRILVTIFEKKLLDKSLELTSYLRNNGVNTELYDNPDEKLNKQLKYADKKGIMYVAILGPEEIKNDMITIKNLRMRDQQTVNRSDLLKVI